MNGLVLILITYYFLPMVLFVENTIGIVQGMINSSIDCNNVSPTIPASNGSEMD